LALYRHGALAAYAKARPLHERALAICEKSLGPEHPHTAASLDHLALLLEDQGNLVGARPLCERALAIREKVLGPEHPFTAESLSNLAGMLQKQGDLVSARPLQERALAIREKALGPEHANTAMSLNNLAHPVYVRTRKSFGLMTRKLSVTESRKRFQFLGTLSRKKSSVASANCPHVA